MTQLSLLAGVEKADRPRKRVREVSREAYIRRRAIDVQAESEGRETAEGKVLRCMAAQYNRSQRWMTDRELCRWMIEQGELNSADPNQVRPRRNALLEQGLVEKLPKRTCDVSGAKAHPWRVTSR